MCSPWAPLIEAPGARVLLCGRVVSRWARSFLIEASGRGGSSSFQELPTRLSPSVSSLEKHLCYHSGSGVETDMIAELLNLTREYGALLSQGPSHTAHLRAPQTSGRNEMDPPLCVSARSTEQNRRRSRAFRPKLCLGVPHIFLAA